MSQAGKQPDPPTATNPMVLLLGVFGLPILLIAVLALIKWLVGF